jgi:hypothetical protein
MNDKLAVTDFNDVAAKLRGRIKSAFVDLIPEDRWDAMLRVEVDKFMAGVPASRDRYGNEIPAKPSEFSVLCQKELAALVGASAQKRFEAMEPENIQVAVSAWIEEHHQEVLRTFIASLFKRGADMITLDLSSMIAQKLRYFMDQNR